MAFVRKDIWTLEPDDPIVTWYRYAVGVMKEREPTAVNSWLYQAAIHGVPEGEGEEPLWNQCQHQTWYFLPWHRMYLLRIEEIIRQVISEAEGPEDWAMPYWNYGLGNQNATLPLAFRQPEVEGQPNYLYVEERAEGMNSGEGEIPPEMASAVEALERPNFVGAAEFGGGEHEPSHKRAGQTGRVEETPHNDVHGAIGGEFGWMGDPDLAAKDPIFWLHHANIDRLWEVWKETEGYVDPEDELWTGQEFELFDVEGNQISLKCEDVQDIEALGYEYDPEAPSSAVPPFEPIPPAPVPALAPEGGEEVIHDKPHMVGATEKPITLVGEPVEVEIPIDAKEAGDLSPAQHVYLNTENVDGERSPGTVYGVYVELPPQASAEAVAAAHVGNLSFFGIERTAKPRGDENPHGLRFAVDITPIAQRLAADGKWAGGRLRVAIKPITLRARHPERRPKLETAAHPKRPITIGRISVFYDA
jgi:tyrosinase